jgi:hypothetical protein
VKLVINFMLSLLKQEADYILDAAEAHAVLINARLPAGFVAGMRTLQGTLRGTSSAQKFKIADVGDLTIAQQTAVNDLYEGLLTIQHAADIQWPDNGNGNTAVRAKFRIGAFPPKQERKKKRPPPAPPAPPA